MEEKKQTNPLGNFEQNIIGAFSYMFPFVTGIAFFLIEKNNKFIRFHAIQSVLFWLAVVIAFSLVDALYFVYFVGILANSLLRIGTVVLWLLLIWKAYQNQEFELPYLGKIAKEQANK